MPSPLRKVLVMLSVLSVGVVAGVSVLLFAAGSPSNSQTATSAVPRLEGTNKPNLEGVWQALNTANFNIEAHEWAVGLATHPGVPDGPPVPAAAVLALGAIGGVPPGESVVEGGDLPYQPWALKQKQENMANALTRDPEVRCFLPGVPRATYMPYPFQIIQSADKIMIVYGYSNAGRTIHLDNVEAGVESWMGHSVGKWEGDTLVVDVTDLKDTTWFDRAGNFHSDALHVVERYTPISPYHLMYEATIDDKKVFTRPWKMKMPLYRHMEEKPRVMEYRCVQTVEELLFGHLRKEQLVKRWEADYGRRGGTLILEVTRKPTNRQDEP
jgi:hypothetical protein